MVKVYAVGRDKPFVAVRAAASRQSPGRPLGPFMTAMPPTPTAG
jgi:hypothetical protein